MPPRTLAIALALSSSVTDRSWIISVVMVVLLKGGLRIGGGICSEHLPALDRPIAGTVPAPNIRRKKFTNY
jgi:hypothetical protein